MFGAKSEHAVDDFLQFLTDDASPYVTGLLRLLAEELTKEDTIAAVMQQLVHRCFERLNSGVQTTGFRSILESVAIAQAAPPLLALCVADKRFAKEVTLAPSFALDDKHAVVGAPPPTFHPNPSQSFRTAMSLVSYPRDLEKHATAGAALEHTTLLGRLLRVSPDPADPAMMEHFREMVKPMSKPAFDAKVRMWPAWKCVQACGGSLTSRHTNPTSSATHFSADGAQIAAVRTRAEAAQRAGADVVTHLLKAGPPAKEAVLRWLLQAMVFGAESSKEQPNPVIAPSRGFQVNLSAVLLALTKPVLVDRAKMKKIDWRFLNAVETTFDRYGGQKGASVAIFPADLTKLMSDGPVGSDAPVPVGDFSFISQSFFMCWRAIHYGVVNSIRIYERQITGRMGPYWDTVDVDPRSRFYFAQQMIIEVQLRGKTFVQEVVDFCDSAAYALLGALAGFEVADGDTTGVASGQPWQVPKAACPEAQLRFLASLPEHFIEDLVTILMFVAKTDPAVLAHSATSLRSTLSLTLFLLRRPWAFTNYNVFVLLGDLIFRVFLPHRERTGHDDAYNNDRVDGPHSALLSGHLESQLFLAPALLGLYGDVDKINDHYGKVGHKRRIMVVLKHLWSLTTHRPAFTNAAAAAAAAAATAAASSSSSSAASEGEVAVPGAVEDAGGDDVHYFVKFANGIIVQTTTLLNDTIKVGLIQPSSGAYLIPTSFLPHP